MNIGEYLQENDPWNGERPQPGNSLSSWLDYFGWKNAHMGDLYPIPAIDPSEYTVMEEGGNPLPNNASNMDFWAQNEDFYDTNYAQMLFSMNEAQKSRDWSEMMSNTSYQRAMADLQSAGLNPILATQYAANVPNASTASGGSGESRASRFYQYATGTSNLVGAVAKVMSGLGDLLSYKYPRLSKSNNTSTSTSTSNVYTHKVKD